MMCYKDKTFCLSAYCTNKCGRQLTREDRIEAAKLDLLISGRIFCDKDGEVIKEDVVDVSSLPSLK